jgi:hypothetical protein
LKGTAGLWNRESIEAKLDATLSEEDYNSFVKPFEGITRLEAIRSSLKPDEIVEPAKASISKTKIVDFPENLPLTKEAASFKGVHNLLSTIERSSLGLQDTDTFAQQHKLEKQKVHILRFLWILGNYGKFEKEKDTYLVVDAEIYLANRGKEKTLSIWSFVEDVVFKNFSNFGVCCERVALKGVKNKDLTTGTGYLRNRGWVMRMAFDEKIGGTAALKALQTYVKRLDKEYGSKAFQRFRNADMRILLDT